MIGGVFETQATSTLISDRCDHLLVIISPAFFKSSLNRFLLRYTQALGVQQSQRKIVPCLVGHCRLPANEIIGLLTCVNYTHLNKYDIFWDRLLSSLLPVPRMPPIPPMPQMRMDIPS